MSAMEITILIFGIVSFIASFLIPEIKSKEVDSINFSEEELQQSVQKIVQNAKTKIEDIADETVKYSLEKTERSLDKITNEKIMAVNEYSDTVLEEIHKNHQEAMFLYDMLNNKSVDLKNTVRKAEHTKKVVAEEKKVSPPKMVEELAEQEIAKPLERDGRKKNGLKLRKNYSQ